jgi:hypothetical protein
MADMIKIFLEIQNSIKILQSGQEEIKGVQDELKGQFKNLEDRVTEIETQNLIGSSTRLSNGSADGSSELKEI